MRTVTAPVRAADLGGWTDTWFAGRGAVCSVAVEPGVTATVEPLAGGAGVRLVAPDRGADYAFDPGHGPGIEPLLEAAVAAAWDGEPVRVMVRAGVAAGSALGTSAAVVVAVLRALGAEGDVAATAHAVETGLGLQSGVQDQLAAAHGGVNLFEVDYPAATVTPVDAPDWLGEALVVVDLGRPHRSSAVHEQVIARLEAGGDRGVLDDLAGIARDGAAALAAGDLDRYGALLDANAACQRALHPDLVCADAARLLAVAHRAGAAGGKVNGAGGDGGSVSIVTPDRRALLAALAAEPGDHRVLDLCVAPRR